MKLAAIASLLAASSASAFVAPGPSAAPKSALAATSSDLERFTNTATVAAATVATTLVTSPLAALAAEDDYEYGAVNAPGGIGLAAGLGVLAILTAAVPVILAPGEDAFNEMKERDEGKWGQ
ncbi:hypothetical protein ACHAXT_011226 [Thalassiosira profunda]